MSSVEALEILRQELSVLRERFHVGRIAVFGSMARGDARADSDVDILVEFTRPVGMVRFVRLERHLAERLGRDVDLVTHAALKPLISERILREARYA